MEEPGLVRTDIDESGLNTGQDGLHLAQVYVSEQPIVVGPVEHHLHQLPVFHERHPRFVGRSAHEDFSPHCDFSPGRSLMTNPAVRSSCPGAAPLQASGERGRLQPEPVMAGQRPEWTSLLFRRRHGRHLSGESPPGDQTLDLCVTSLTSQMAFWPSCVIGEVSSCLFVSSA